MVSKKERNITLSLFVVYMLLLTWIILFKLQLKIEPVPDLRSINLIPFSASLIVNGKIDTSEIFANIFVFVPVGVYISMLKPEWSFFKKVVPGFALSLFFEIFQYILAVGSSDITDVIDNTLGGIIGILVFQLLTIVLGKRTVKILNILAGIATGLAIIFFAVLIFTNM